MSARNARSARTLLLDIGNTRVKWAVLNGARLGRMQAAAHAGWTQADFARHVITRAGKVDRVFAVSVAGARVDRLLSSAVQERAGLAVEFFATPRRAGGVTTQYSEPWRLGADRLIGAIGGRQFVGGRAVCIVSVGTTVTVDLVDERGCHRGGAIAPAPELMKHSLLSGTSGIRRRAGRGSSAGRLFARNTRDAIEQGTRFAVAALIDRGVQEARRTLERTPQVLLTGGGAKALRPLIQARHVYVPDLVLQGLAVLVSAEHSGAP